MPTIINPIITNPGLAAAQAQSGLGLQLAITHVQLGSGGYALNTAAGSADYNRTGLVTLKETVPIAAGHVTGPGFRVDALFPPWLATAYGVNEVGFWAGDPAAGGILFAYWAQVASFTTRNNIDYLASFAVGLARVPAGSVTVTFNPSTAEAIAMMSYHEAAADPHPQYVKKAGDTMTGALNLVLPAQFDDSAKAASSAFVRRALGSVAGVDVITTSTNLLTTQVGRLIVSAAVGLTHRLPAMSSLTDGCAFHFFASAGSMTLLTTGSDLINYGTGVAGPSLKLLQGESASFARNGATGNWQMIGGTGAMKHSAAFSNSLTAQGWQMLPTGFLEQWGTVNVTATDTDFTFTLPIAYPVAALAATITCNKVGSSGAPVSIQDAWPKALATTIVFRSGILGTHVLRVIGA